MKIILQKIEHFLFQPISSIGFSAMRIAWGIQEFITFACTWSAVHIYYTTAGVMGPITCTTLQCSITETLLSEPWIHMVFIVLLLSLLAVIIGYYPRIFILISLVLISFLQYRNGLMLNGGDRIEKIIGFLLLIAPAMNQFSLYSTKKFMNAIWVQRILLWQLIVLYSTAGLHKFQVTGWLNGHKLGISLHLEQFARLPVELTTPFESLYVPMSLVIIGVQIAWLLLLIPTPMRRYFIWKKWPMTLKQTIVLGTAAMHIGILIFMDIDMFAVTMLISYIGLLDEYDIQTIKRLIRFIRRQPTVLALQ